MIAQVLEYRGQRFWFTDDEPVPSLPALAYCGFDEAGVSLMPHVKARSPGWSALERKFIAEHGECIACGGKKFLQVHHVKPFHLFPAHELDEDNLRTLCMAPGHSCHFRVGHGYDWTKYVETVDLYAAYDRHVLAELKGAA